MSADVIARVDDNLQKILKSLDGEAQFRDWVHKKFDEIKGAIFGNGKKGLVRDMDQVQTDVSHLKEDFVDFKNEVKGLVRAVAGWAITSCVAAICLIVFEVVMFILRKGP